MSQLEGTTEQGSLEARLLELQALFELSRTVNSSLNLQQILDSLLLSPMGRLMISKGMALLRQEEGGVTIAAIKGLPTEMAGTKVEITADVFLPTPVSELPDVPTRAFFQKFGIELLVPIISNSRTLGYICFGPKITSRSFSPPDLEFLHSLSNLAATAVQNGLIFQELRSVNRRLDKKIQELNTLFEIGKELIAVLDSEKVVNLLSFAVMGELMVNRCLIFLKTGDRMKLRLAKGFRSTKEVSGLENEELLHALARIDKHCRIEDCPLDEAKAPLQDAGIQVLAPMRIQDETKGLIALGPKITQAPYADDELEFLQTLGNLAMISIENARLFEETLEKKRLEEELNIARDIQRRLLPKELPKLDGFELAAVNVSSQQVGGDYYDCISIDGHRYGIAIADVSGKGVPAALLMANLQASLRAFVRADVPLTTMVSRISDIIHENTGIDKYITFFYGALDTQAMTFTYCNAGHNPPYLFHRDGSFQKLEEGGVILGIMPGSQYRAESVELKPGDVVVMYTDGVTEAMNPKDEEFDEFRLEAVVREHLDQPASQIIEHVAQAVREFAGSHPQSDDITMFVVRVC